MEDQSLLQREEEDERKGDCLLGQRGVKERSAIWGLGACVIVLTAALVATVLALTVPAEASEADLFVHLRGFCAGVQGIAAEEYLARQESLRQLLSQHQLSAALFEAGSDLQYFTGVRWSRSERPFLFVLLANGSSLYVAPDFEAARANQSLLWADGVALATWQEDEDPYLPADAFVASYCAALASCPLLLGHDTRVFIATGLQNSWQLASDAPSNHDNASSPAVLQLEDEPEVVASLRRVKSAAEMAILRCASEATKASLAAVQPLIREGMSESELKGLLFSAQTSAGLSDLWALVLFGANAALPHGTADKLKLQSSMGVLLDTGGSLLGYQSDVSRTIYPLTHDIPPQELLAWNTVRSAQLAALQAISQRQANATCGDIDAAARSVVAEAGFGSDYQFFTHRLGHGIGLDGHEEPYLVRANPLPLQPGFVFSVEPGLYNLTAYGVRLEDIVAVIAEPPGYEVLGALQDSPFSV